MFAMAASLSLAVWVAIGNGPTILVSIIEFALLVFASQKTALTITVTKGWLLVGPAAIERAFIHNFAPLEFSELKRTRGIDADPASYLELRFWVSSAIKIDLRDPKDKTPYWLITTNRAKELAKILNLADH